MTLIELRDFCNKKLEQHNEPNSEVFINGNKIDNVAVFKCVK